MFRRNRFGRECISELSEVLKRNGVIKEVMFTESNVGSVGAGFLASALKVNDSLEELQIWEDSIGSKGAEELSKAVRRFHRLYICLEACKRVTAILPCVVLRPLPCVEE
ncbi:hypothetical protein ACLB2K_010261 [Fragaria x ananassa]